MSTTIHEHIYYVRGLHCASCEVLVEKKLLELKNIKAVEVSVAKGEARIEYEEARPTAASLTALFQKENYIFSDKLLQEIKDSPLKERWTIAGIGLLIILGFWVLNKLGLSSLINVSAQTALPMFFVFGLIAGISSCAALVGGIILSMSKQWNELHAPGASLGKRLQPHLLFNAGRIISYGLFGAVLGAIGSQLGLSLKLGPAFVMIVSIMMIILALQMFGFKSFRRFQFTAPKSVTRFVSNEAHFKGRYMPFIMGALTFILPCGFTITAQGLALISGSALQGGLIMFLFALGTLPMLLIIGLSSVKFSQKAKQSARFLKVAGILVLFFALYNINFQLNVLGAPSLSTLSFTAVKSSSVRNNSDKNLPPIVNGRQIIKMNASVSGYTPSYFQVRVGVPVRWEITDTGTSGCTNAVISRSLFAGSIPLTPGQVSVKEFTPSTVGRYKFSCWMGMVSGIIDVVDPTVSSLNLNLSNVSAASFALSGAESSGGSCRAGGCGCGGR